MQAFLCLNLSLTNIFTNQMLQSRLTLYLDKSLIQIEKYMFEKDETHLIEVTTFTMPKIFIPIVMTSSMGLSFAVSLKMSL